MKREPNLSSRWFANRASRSPLASTIGVFAIALLVLTLTMNRTVGVYDEGLILTGAARVAAGDHIHRDFYANYGPAQFHLLATLFNLFGSGVLTERLADIVIRASISAASWVALSGLCRRPIAAIGAGLISAWLAFVGNHGYPVYPTLLLALIATILLTRDDGASRRSLPALLAGVLVGLAALFRYDIGFMAAVAHMAGILITRRDARLHAILTYAAGAALPVLPLLAWYYASGALGPFLHDTLTFPARFYVAMRGLPFPTPGLTKFSIYLPGIAVVLALIAWSRRRSAADDKPRRFLLFFLLITLAFYLKGVGRVSIEHVQLALIPAIVLLTALSGDSQGRRRWLPYGAALCLVITAINVGAAGQRKLGSSDAVVLEELSGFLSNPGEFKPEGAERGAALAYIRDRTRPEDPLFVGLTRHDKIFVNDVSAYFLANRRPATHWYHFDPGLQTSAPIQRQMIADLEASRPPVVWLESTWNDVREPNRSAESSGVRLLDDYLAAHYVAEATFGPIIIARRK